MKYLCLVYAEEEGNDDDPSGSRNGVLTAIFDFEEELRQSGHALLFAPVPPDSATMVTISQRSVSISAPDCTADQLRACFLLQARDLNEAIRLAGRMHGPRATRIEVHPVLERKPSVEH